MILPPRRFDMGARALNQTKLAVAKPAMNTDTKSTDIPYRPSKAPGITRCTTLLMIAYGDAGCGGGGSEGAASSSIPIGANLQCFGVMFNVF